MATILYRYAKKPEVKNNDILKDYTDAAKVSEYAKDAMMQRTIPVLEAK